MFDKGQFTLDNVDSFSRPVNYEHDIIIPLEHYDATLTACAYEYESKEDFLFHMVGDRIPSEELNYLNNSIPSGKVVTVSFRNESSVHQMQMHPHERTYALQRFIPCLRIMLNEGIAGLLLTNQTVVAKNIGRKVYDDLTDKSKAEGARQRGLLSKRLGLGDMDQYGYTILQPL